MVAASRTRLQRFKARLLPIALGGVGAIIATLLLAAWLWRDGTPPLTREMLESAQARWQQAGVKDYALDVEIAGKRAGRVHLEVRGGEPTAMTRDGVTPAQRRTWSAWTVDGMLDMMRMELDAAENPEKGFGAAEGARLVQRAQFDDALGYPLRYERIMLGTDHSLDIDWRVVRFEGR